MLVLVALVVLASSPCDSVAACRAACGKGEPAACRELGARLHRGDDGRPDESAARWAYEQACQLGDAGACLQRANFDLYGWGGPRQFRPACAWLTLACERNSGEGCSELGRGHNLGECTPDGKPDPYRALEYLKKSCTLKNGDACFRLAGNFHEGALVERDERRAQDLYARACQLKQYKACIEVAETKAEQRAFRTPADIDVLLWEPCEKGEPLACLYLGQHYRSGTAGRRDSGAALQYAKRACSLKLADGCELALALLRQRTGRQEPTREVVALTEDLCVAGRPQACAAAGAEYLSGERVPFRDVRRAVELYDRACRADARWCQAKEALCQKVEAKPHCASVVRRWADWSEEEIATARADCEANKPAACMELAYAYLHGERVVRDSAKALELYLRACALKDRDACRYLDELGGMPAGGAGPGG